MPAPVEKKTPLGFLGGSDGKESPCIRETRVPSLGQEDPLEKGMATHSSILAWKIPWREEPGGLQSVGSQRVGHLGKQVSPSAAAPQVCKAPMGAPLATLWESSKKREPGLIRSGE